MPPLRSLWFQLHWFVGITAGTVLALIGLTGATLSFRAEIVDALNPALRSLPAPAGATALAPADLAARLQAAEPLRRIAALTLHAEAGRPARVNFAPLPGAQRGEQRLIDPWTAALLPQPRGDDFFEFVESLHRWLLLPRDAGKAVTGTLAGGLLLLALSGLYLRWPRRPLSWRAWLRLDFALRGRAFLWNLHAVAGTVALLCYLVSALTGLYWGFDTLRSALDEAAGEGRAQRMQRVQAGPAASPARAPDLQRLWQSFLQERRDDWSLATLRLPSRNAPQVELTYLDARPEHERARNRIYLDAATGEIALHQRYADKPLAGRLVHSVYPLHMGSYWGLPGRIAMTLASLGLLVFAVTGWMLYLGRRRTKQSVRAERVRLGAGPAAAPTGPAPVLLGFATQTGHAERIALQTAAALQAAGVAAVVQPLSRLSAEVLRQQRHLLVVASSFGDGAPPDSARAFAHRLAQQAGSGLQQLRYGLLALGDRNYANFCGFGHALDQGLRRQGAQPMFAPIEVDNGDAAALARWSQALADSFGVALAAPSVAPDTPFESWRLARRTLLNVGSQGEPLFEIELAGPTTARWTPGALVEIRPRGDGDTQAQADAPTPRRYSVGSIPADGCIQLLVRQARRGQQLGLASGWLTARAPIGTPIELRLLPNPGFTLIDGDAPCLFIGNGSGFAGLRAHLRERMRRGHGRNWLVYGERQAAHDAFCAAEVAAWRAAGLLARADLVFSRDQAQRRYVQDLLREAGDRVRRWVADGAVIYVCGSLEGMAPGVDAALGEVLGDAAFEDLVAAGRLRRDVY